MRWKPTRAHARTRGMIATLVLAVAMAATAGIASTQAASQSVSVTVSMTVPSATNIDLSSCATGTPDVTEFGAVLPGSSKVMGNVCSAVFGSSNDTAMLRLHQRDGFDVAMFAYPDGDTFNFRDINDVDAANAENLEGVDEAPDGDFIAAGWVNDGANDSVVATKVDTAGVLDAGFGGGIVTHSIGTSSRAQAVQIQPDGKTIVAGWTDSGNRDVMLLRLNTDGTLDTSFDGDGIRVDDFGSGLDDEATDVRLRPDGRILVVGHVAAGSQDSLIAQYLPNGSPDNGFDGDGERQLTLSAGADALHGVEIQPDGMAVASGMAFMADDDFAVIRFDESGVLDTSFDGDGIGTYDHAGSDVSQAIDIADDGTIVFVGSPNAADIVVGKLLTDGSLDPAFGSGGMQVELTWSSFPDYAEAVTVLADNRILVGGRNTSTGVGWLLRLHADGSRDTSFNSGGTAPGYMVIQYGTGNEHFWDMHVGQDGSIVAVGNNDDASDDELYLTHVEGTDMPDYLLNTNDWDTASPNDGFFGACLDSITGATTVATWTEDPDTCSSDDSDPWYAVEPLASDPNGKVAESSGSGTTTATVNLRFGVRVPANQPAEAFVAPVSFEAVAPNV